MTVQMAEHLYDDGEHGKTGLPVPTATGKKYGFSPYTFWNYIQELIEGGFVVHCSNKNPRQPNDYSFSFAWILPKEPALLRPIVYLTKIRIRISNRNFIGYPDFG